ncbi:type II TA system antitoxin MqsA family protein [Pseudoroseomonas globiformis]|uniref:Type II TA system antitoxin MqsA family protein n=1 Tax=Teichococcus globiformis TaxID=2307229 RepID=A0ABV7FXH5_9PROT
MTDTCVNCGQAAVCERTVPFDVERDGQRVTIQDRQTYCAACGQVSYRGNQISEHERAVAAATRQMLGLLTSDELQAIRKKYFLLQREMEEMLSIGPKTWVRWERGKVVQSKSVDKLIRSIAEDPALAQKLMHDACIDNPEAEAAFQRFHEQARSRAAEVMQSRLGHVAGADYGAVAEDVIRAIHLSASGRRAA